MIKTIITEKVEKTEEIDSVVCDICEREFRSSDWIDWQEFFSFKNYCGYGSVFGDGTAMRVDVCQHCINYTMIKNHWVCETLSHN
jgi:hypothetical protein